MCAYVYVYIYVCIYTYTHTYIYTYIWGKIRFIRIYVFFYIKCKDFIYFFNLYIFIVFFPLVFSPLISSYPTIATKNVIF